MPKSFKTGDQSLVREFNRAILLNLLRTHSPQSRADLAATTGLNKTTVSSLVAELISAGLAREIGQAISAGGRPAVLLELNPDAGYIIGAELGVWFIKIVLTDFRATVLWRQQIPLQPGEDSETAVNQLIDLAREAVEIAEQAGQKVFGMGLGMHGLVDVRSGTLLFGPNFGWRDTPVRRRLEEVFPFPIFADNDAKASAIGEHYFGVAQHVDNFIYVIANVGLGAGIWLGGQIYRGATGSAGEVGHTTILPDGLLCKCGNHGCWETLVSQQALMDRLQAAVAAGSPTCLPLRDGRLTDLTIPIIVEAAKSGDALVLQVLEETGRYLGIGIANLINTFNPSVVVFGGTLSQAAEFLLPSIQQVVAERSMPWPRAAVQILVAAHRFDSCVMGGVALVLHDMLSHPRLDAPIHHRSSNRKSLPKEVRPNPNTLLKPTLP
ncbi:MAG: ROK family transcriptional regulator [Chloroflexi bacterium]|nr:ROK family transcriptional regulator [Chloroflexota bacterium]